MSDNRKYYYLKLKENYFDDDSIVLLESMQDGVLYSNILLKLYPSSLFRVSGTQRTHSTTNARTAPLTLTPKSIRNFQRECALTRNRSVPQECAACIHRMQNARGLGTAQQAF